MSSVKKFLVAFSFSAFVLSIAGTADAHLVFRKQMQEKFPGMKVDCKACHVDKKPKTERNEFGKLFATKLKKSHPDLTKDYKSKKGAEKKAYEKETLIPAFVETLKKVKVETNKEGETYDDLIKAGKIPEIVKDPDYKPDEEEKKEGDN